VLKRDGGFATQDAAKIAGREDAKKMRNMRQPRPDVGRTMPEYSHDMPDLPGQRRRLLAHSAVARAQKSTLYLA
jgi:hypothetical protein